MGKSFCVLGSGIRIRKTAENISAVSIHLDIVFIRVGFSPLTC